MVWKRDLSHEAGAKNKIKETKSCSEAATA